MLEIKRLLMLIMLAAAFCLVFAQADSLDFPAPQYMLPMYDHYTVNHSNVEAMGRGWTVDAVTGGAESAVNNPATLVSDKAKLYMELTIKPPLKEVNQSNEQMYTSPLPFGIFGFSGKVYKGLQGAISYNVPKSLVYDNFTVNILQGNDEVVRYPTYYLHQFTATLAGSLGNWRLGLNLQNQLHQFKDITVFQTFDRVDETYYVLRLQPGVLYSMDKLKIGATILPPATRKMDIKYAVYDVTLPLQASTGVSYEFGLYNKISADVQWEQFSAMTDAFKDRLTLRAGFEKRINNFTYRAGVNSIPGIYKGAYRLPIRPTVNAEELQWWQNVDKGGIIGDTDQLNISIGFTFHFKGGKLAMGLMQDALGNVPATQVSMALGFNLETLKGKKFLIFDKQ
jgi:hypothetical protein